MGYLGGPLGWGGGKVKRETYVEFVSTLTYHEWSARIVQDLKEVTDLYPFLFLH